MNEKLKALINNNIMISLRQFEKVAGHNTSNNLQHYERQTVCIDG